MKRICLTIFALAMPFSVQADTGDPTYSYERVAFFPTDRSLVRPEDGVMLADGTLLIADQVHGLVALDLEGAKRPFGDFAAAGYVHEPPDRSAGPNGVAMEPDGIHVLVAVDLKPMDGALFRLGPTDDHEPQSELRRMDSGLDFANGLAIDEVRGQLYVAETMANRIIGYRLSMPTGRLSDHRVIEWFGDRLAQSEGLKKHGTCGSPMRTAPAKWTFRRAAVSPAMASSGTR